MNHKYTLNIVNVVNDYSLVSNEVSKEVYRGPSPVFLWVAVAQWGKGVILQPQGCRFDPGSPH